MVELLRRYSNRADLVKPIQDVLRRIRERDQTDEPGVATVSGSRGRWVPLAERIGQDGAERLVADRRAGVRIRELAERYGISESTVKRVLRRAKNEKSLRREAKGSLARGC